MSEPTEGKYYQYTDEEMVYAIHLDAGPSGRHYPFYQCRVCGYEDTDRSKIRQHFRSEHGDGPVQLECHFKPEVIETDDGPRLEGLVGMTLSDPSYPGTVTIEGSRVIPDYAGATPHGVINQLTRRLLGRYRGKQRQRGGRKPGKSKKVREHWSELAQDYWRTLDEYREIGERLPTQEEFAKDRGVSVATLQRALKWDEEQKRGVKESP